MNFITELAKTTTCFDGIAKIVDILSRRVHFMPSHKTNTAEDTAKSSFHHILPQHGIPDAIISDRDTKST